MIFIIRLKKIYLAFIKYMTKYKNDKNWKVTYPMNTQKLSELPMNTKLFIENSYNSSVEIIDKEDFLIEIQTSWRDYFEDDMSLYIAEPHPQVFDINDICDFLERFEDDNYEDWLTDMFDSVKDCEETKVFLNMLNKTAQTYITYYPGAPIDVDIKLYNEDGSRALTVVGD